MKFLGFITTKDDNGENRESRSVVVTAQNRETAKRIIDISMRGNDRLVYTGPKTDEEAE